MPMRRVVAAKSNTAGLAGAQVQPFRVQPDAFLTNVFFGGLYVGDGAQMFAKICHESKGKFFYRFIFFSRTSLMAADFVMDRARRK